MFSIGQKVKLKIDDSQIGIVTSSENGKYIVFLNGKDMTCYEDQLLPFEGSNLLPDQMDKDHFLYAYTAKKFSLKHSSSLFALNAGDIDFIPFQYRPLRKILNAFRPRILIADEVGVGKTIEAGIIVKEFEKRESANRVLVICPKELTLKWQNEMNLRFQETFRILNSSDLDYCLRETKLDEWPREYSRCIIGLEMIRRDEWIDKLKEITDPSHFDILIVDEAHHVCNRSKGREVVSFLSEHSFAAVFLSATPLQLGSEDLFSLLNMLSPDEFVSWDTFKDMADPNQYVNNAIRMVKARPQSWRIIASEELDCIYKCNSWAYSVFKDNPIRKLWNQRLLDETYVFTDERRVKCIDDLQSLNTFSSIINRTRRRDIAKSEAAFTIRDPVTVKTRFSAEELALYEEVTQYKFDTLALKYGKIVALLVMSTIERMVTSSIHAFAENIEAFLSSSISSFLSDDSINEETGELDIDVASLLDASRIRYLASALPERDEKLEQLIKVVEDARANDNGKLLVFSFFTKTISYLKRKLSSLGYRVETITGQTKQEERQIIRNRFKSDQSEENAVDILICSEVGCEGLDYQFCSRMVNFDIPWNPMKIEQRIGRIDRYGQKAPKVKIYNFITSDTVEEKIFYRCFDRLGVFSNTIGDLESVLGEITEQLNETAFNTSLTQKERERRSDEIARNIIENEKELQRAEKDSESLFLLDLPSQDKETKQERSLIIRQEVFLLSEYLKSHLPSSDIGARGPIIRVSLHSKQSKESFQALLNSLAKKYKSKSVRNLVKRIEMGKTDFEFSLERSQLNEETFLLTPDHPLLLDAQRECQYEKARYDFAVKSDVLPAGKYHYGVFVWKELGYKESESLKVAVMGQDGMVWFLDNFEFETMLLNSESMFGEEFDPSCFDQMLRNESIGVRDRLYAYNADLVHRKIKTFESHFDMRINQADGQLRKTSDPKIKLMLSSEIQRLTQEKAEVIEQLKAKGKADIFFDLFAWGTMEVKPL